MTGPAGHPTHPRIRLWLIPVGLLIVGALVCWFGPGILLQIQYGGMPIAGWTVGFPPDCLWDAHAVAWIDENRDGQFQAGEEPLPDVVFHVDDVVFRVKDAARATTGSKGDANLVVWLAGCPQTSFEIYPDSPSGLELTTSPRQTADVRTTDKTFEFGFHYREGVPTSTPYAAKLACTKYPGIEPQDMALAPDGSLWVALWDGAARFDSATGQFVSDVGQPGLYDRIDIGSHGEVWVSSQEIRISRYFNAAWLTWQEDALITGSDLSFGTSRDGRVWFARAAPPYMLASFNPLTDQWRFFVEPLQMPSAVGTKVRASTDGSTWFAAFGDLADLTPPDSTPSLRWTIYDPHSFAGSEVQEIPDLEWIYDSKIDPQGLIWLSTVEGLANYDPSADRWKVADWPRSSDLFPVVDSKSLAIAPDGSIWIGASSSGRPLVLRFAPNDAGGTWRTYDDRDGLPDSGEIDSLELTPDGRLWLAMEYATSCTVLQ